MSATPNIAVPAPLLDGFVQYVEVSSLTTKRALDEVAVHRAAQKKAADLRPALLDYMVATKVVPAAEKQAAEVMLGAHDTTLQLLKSAVDKIAEVLADNARLRGGVKQAGLGAAEPGAAGVAAGGTYQHAGEYNSLTHPIVGEKTANAKESDKSLLRLAGIVKD